MGRQKKYKPSKPGRMIKDIKKMAPGKKIGGQMVRPMAATQPFGLFTALAKGATKTAKTLGTAAKTGAKTASAVTAKTVSKADLAAISNAANKASNLPPSYSSITSTAAKTSGTLAEKAKTLWGKARPVLDAAATITSLGLLGDAADNDSEAKPATTTLTPTTANDGGPGYRQGGGRRTTIINNYNYGDSRPSGGKRYGGPGRYGGGSKWRDDGYGRANDYSITNQNARLYASGYPPR